MPACPITIAGIRFSSRRAAHDYLSTIFQKPEATTGGKKYELDPTETCFVLALIRTHDEYAARMQGFEPTCAFIAFAKVRSQPSGFHQRLKVHVIRDDGDTVSFRTHELIDRWPPDTD